MKIGIMTWFQYHNYGTALQAYALSLVCKKLGHAPYLIKYYAKGNAINETLIKKIKTKSNEYLHKNNYNNKNRIEKFNSFFNTKLVFSTSSTTLSELEDLNSEMDAFICGSDQIWSPLYFDSHYYLDFVKDPNKMIAYAPSFGVSNITNNLIEKKIAFLVARFKYISVREKAGANLISNLLNKSVETVLDPTFLLTKEEWEKQATLDDICTPSTKYALVYMLGRNKYHWENIKLIAQKYNLNLKIIPVYKADYKRKGCIQEAIGPLEFIHLIRNSDFVLTDSFHGTIFSIIFNKQFFVFERFKSRSKDNQNSRIYNILELTGLSNRIFHNKTDLQRNFIPINFQNINVKIQHQRYKSLRYLQSSLNSIEKYLSSAITIKNNIRKTHSICCGCGICKNICPTNAISIQMSEDGFKKAIINDKQCISCGKCRQVCPFIKNRGISIEGQKVYSYKDSRKKILLSSSSGGVAYALSEIAIENGFKIIGCEFDKETQQAKHICIKSESELYKLQGSKYLQSDLTNVISVLKEKDKKLFFGTPCQISAAKRLYGNQAIYVDLICHGIPSYNLFIRYKEFLQQKYHITTKNLNPIFRFKEKGWRNKYICIESEEKRMIFNHRKDPFYLAFENSICLGEQCYECPWRIKSDADIRIGDFWGGEI